MAVMHMWRGVVLLAVLGAVFASQAPATSQHSHPLTAAAAAARTLGRLHGGQRQTAQVSPQGDTEMEREGEELYVIKRDGRKQQVMFDKITARIRRLCEGLDQRFVDPVRIAQEVVMGVYPGVTTAQLDTLASETAYHRNTEHPDYAKLAARIEVSNLHKDTKATFSETITDLYNYIDPKTGQSAGIISERVYNLVMKNKERINAAIKHERDYDFDYFGIKTLEKAYLLRINGKIAERPQYMLMRVAVGIHMEDIDAALETYELMSQKWFLHASPTLFHAGTQNPQMSSCFLLTMQDDSIEGIYDTLKRCALISKAAGGIGIAAHNIRAKGTYIKGTKGVSNGLVPMLRVFDSTARYVDQGGGKRPGAFAVYLEPWHADIFEVLDLKKNRGKEELRARDLFYAMWIPDLFMKRVEENGVWSLFCPHECPGLADCYGEEFEQLYTKYERAGKFRRQVKAQELWFAILESQIETGNPYMLYKDACNQKSNQKNLGTIRCSNLCTEIVEYTAPDEVAVCNLASVCLPKFAYTEEQAKQLEPSPERKLVPYTALSGEVRFYDHGWLHKVVKVMTRNLNRIIDENYYPIEEARRSNLRHRPIGLGVQGLADAFILMGLPFDSPEAMRLNRDMFETIYHAALEASCELAQVSGAYETFNGSPASKGILQPDMWGVTPSKRWDWATLRQGIKSHGLRNSLLVAPMPTASTAQILGYNECIEPYTSNLYVRRVKAGEFTVINPHLLKDLVDRKLWTKQLRNQLIAEHGSVQNIAEIPEDMRHIYRTVWEIKQKSLLDMAADRGAFIGQSQSLNAFIAAPDFSKLTSMHFYGWKKGLKTGMYYLRTKPAANAIQFTVDQAALAQSRAQSRVQSGLQKTAQTTAQPAASQQPRQDDVATEDRTPDTRTANPGDDDIVCISCQG